MSVNGIPQNILKPGFYGAFNTSGAGGLGSFSQKLLLIGQQMATGIQPPLTPIQVFAPSDAATLFGAGSVAHIMVAEAMAQDPGLAPFVIGVSDAAASVAATGTVTFTGLATANGTLVFYVAFSRLELGVQSGDTPTILAARLAALVSANTALPVTAAAAAGVLTFTAKNKGTNGNAILLNRLDSVAGVTVALVAMASGATDPTIQPALDAVTPGQFHVVASQFADAISLAAIKTYLDLVSSAVEERPGRAFVAVTGATKSVAAQVTLATNLNHERSHIVYLPGCWSLPWEVSAAVAGQVAAETDPARPFDGIVLTDVHAPATALLLIRTEQETLLAAGVTPLEVDNAGNVSIVRLVTTRTLTAGAADLTLLDSTTLAILDYYRQEVRAIIKRKYGQAKTTDRVLNAIRADALDVAYRLEKLEILQHVSDYKNQFQAVRDPNYPGRAILSIPAPWVPGLHQLFATFNLITVI